MTAKHTPGPWTAERQDGEDGGIYYAIHGAGYTFVTNVDEFDNREDMVANARLIAAAPDLLEAAKFAYAAMDSEEGRKRARASLIAAIAKAAPPDDTIPESKVW